MKNIILIIYHFVTFYAIISYKIKKTVLKKENIANLLLYICIFCHNPDALTKKNDNFLTIRITQNIL